MRTCTKKESHNNQPAMGTMDKYENDENDKDEDSVYDVYKNNEDDVD